MAAFEHPPAGEAAAVYLALYTLLLPVTSVLFYRAGFKSIFFTLWFFNVIRFGSQLCGLVFAKVGFEHYQWLIAYLVLGAEGYFMLILTGFYTVIWAQHEVLGSSWLESYGPFGEVKQKAKGKKFLRILLPTSRTNWGELFHFCLIPANGLLIGGGTMLAGLDVDEYSTPSGRNKINVSKGLRTAGQAIFLALSLVMIATAIHTYIRLRVRSWIVGSVLVAAPFFVVRGIFGILSIYLDQMNYYAMSNYTSGAASHLAIYEYVLSTTMEFVAACIMVSTYYTRQQILRSKQRDQFLTDQDSVQEGKGDQFLTGQNSVQESVKETKTASSQVLP